MAAITELPEQQFTIFKFIPVRLAPWLLAIVACLIYSNTLPNQFALDDDLVFKNNKYVQQGFKGIPTILTSDIFASYFEDYQVEQVLSGGRYRPLSQATFAIEHQFFGANPMVGHAVNMVLYGLLVFILFTVLLRSFRLSPDIVFIATLLFALHPIHTEVVANIKSRDEILSLLFILLSFRYFLNYIDTGKSLQLWLAGSSVFLAFLSKEYAYALVVLLPLAITTFRPMAKNNAGKMLPAMLMLLAATMVFTMIRYSVVGMNIIEQDDILNNPYLHATPVEALATKIFVLGKYLLLLLFPHPLSADYSYPHFPFLTFSSPMVLISLVIYLGLTGLGIYYAYKRHFMGFAILTFLLFLFPVSNLLVDIGATMGERLMFHPSLGFCLAISHLLVKLSQRYSLNKAFVIFPVLLISVAAVAKTMDRNRAWYNTNTLFLTDVKTVPKAVISNANAADALLAKAWVEKDSVKKQVLLVEARGYLDNALRPYPEFVNALVNLGLVQHLQGKNDSALANWMLGKKYLPQSPHFPKLGQYFFELGMTTANTNVSLAIQYLHMAAQLDGKSEYWSNLGGAYFTIKQYDNAMACWDTALKINPNDPEAKKGKAALTYAAPPPAK